MIIITSMVVLSTQSKDQFIIKASPPHMSLFINWKLGPHGAPAWFITRVMRWGKIGLPLHQSDHQWVIFVPMHNRIWSTLYCCIFFSDRLVFGGGWQVLIVHFKLCVFFLLGIFFLLFDSFSDNALWLCSLMWVYNVFLNVSGKLKTCFVDLYLWHTFYH